MNIKLLLVTLLFCIFAIAQKGIPPKDVVNINMVTKYPTQLDFSPELVKTLKVPAGWEVTAVASGLGKPRMLYIAAGGRLYITRRDTGDVVVLSEAGADGKFTDNKTAVSEFKGVHGITIKDGWLFLCNNKELRRYKLREDGTADADSKQTLIDDLPSGGQHADRTIDFGPDGMLYISVGSVCNDCVGDKETATMLQVDPKNWKRITFASGLRNTIGIDFQPGTNDLWGMDNGCDYKGDNWPPEELNKIIRNADYGYPFAYGKREIDKTREDPVGSTKEAAAMASQPSIMEFPAHGAPIAFKFFGNATPFAGDGLVCWHGSWNCSQPEGYKVQRIIFENGMPTGVEDFLSGFLVNNGDKRFGRPAGLAITQDGTVYVSDDANGVIYRVKQKSKS
jgi:glucose/arabinose dehydrogenase